MLEKVWLNSREGMQVRLEKRQSTLQGSHPVYRYSEKNLSASQLKMRRIGAREYAALRPLASADHVATLQLVRNFVFKDQYFSLVKYLMPRMEDGFEYVEVRASDKDDIKFPSFISVQQEVTKDVSFTSFFRSKC